MVCVAKSGALLGVWSRQGLNLGLAGDMARPRQGNTLYQQCRQSQDCGHGQMIGITMATAESQPGMEEKDPPWVWSGPIGVGHGRDQN